MINTANNIIIIGNNNLVDASSPFCLAKACLSIQHSFDKLSIPTQQVQTVEDARDSDCSHYFLYSAKFKHTFTKKSSYKIYQVNHSSTKFFPLANIGIKQKIYFDGSNGAQEIIDKVVKSLVTGQANEEL